MISLLLFSTASVTGFEHESALKCAKCLYVIGDQPSELILTHLQCFTGISGAFWGWQSFSELVWYVLVFEYH